jgi:MerR family transcriptional regulator, light-induced transcriptional regulator
MPVTKPLLTPKELADAIGASESSLRRWVDGGGIRMSRTAGGHRRIPIQEAVRFIRETGATLVRPEILGLGDQVVPVRRSAPNAPSDEQALFDALVSGNRRVAKGLILSRYLEGHNLPALFDGPVRGAMKRLGDLWQHEQRGILVEHRGTDICLEALLELRTILPSVPANAPVALGGAPEGDPYLIPSTMAAMVLAEAGYRDINYGGQTPLRLLAEATAEHNAVLVWISATAPLDHRSLRRQIAALGERLAARKCVLAMGGRHAADSVPKGLANVHLTNSMVELSAFAKGILSASRPAEARSRRKTTAQKQPATTARSL